MSWDLSRDAQAECRQMFWGVSQIKGLSMGDLPLRDHLSLFSLLLKFCEKTESCSVSEDRTTAGIFPLVYFWEPCHISENSTFSLHGHFLYHILALQNLPPALMLCL